MVPRKFNIVDFGGFDLAEQYGEALPGIYDKIVDAHWNCVYIMCFGLKFGGFDIAPQYMTPEMFSDHIMLNGIISIDQNDVITVPSIEPPAPPPDPPVVQPLNVIENGTYTVSEGIDGFNPVTVNVPVGGGEYFSQRILPTEYDLDNGGFLSGNIWYVTGGAGTKTDIYRVEANKRYIVFSGETYGNRFRVAFFNTNPAEATVNLSGVEVGSISPSHAYACSQPYYVQTDGYIAVAKCNNNVTGLLTYVFEVRNLV